MQRYLNLYGAFLGQQFKSYAEYRANFIIGASSTIMMQAANLLTVWVVMQQIPDFNGWGFSELLLIYGLITLSKSINHMFADNLWTVGRVYIRSGQFDRFLVRPIDPLFHLIADRFCYDGVGNFLVGVVLLGAALAGLDLTWTPLVPLYIVLAVLSGGGIFIALNLITCVSSFWIMDSVPVTRAIFDNHLFAQYPLTIYPKAVTTLLTWLIPYGFASFYPASYLLGRDVGVYAWAGPVVAAVLLFAGYRFWLFGLRHYSGTGS